MNGQPEVLSRRRINGATAASAKLTPIRCLSVDGHPAVRLGLRELLVAEPGFEVLDAFATAETAVAFAERTRVDVAVVDYQPGWAVGLGNEP